VDPTQITETERPVRSARPAKPQAKVWRLLRDAETERRAARAECGDRVAAEHDRLTALLVDVVNARDQLQVFLQHKRKLLAAAGLNAEVKLLAALDARLGTVVGRAGAQVVGLDDLDGQRYDIDAMEPFADMIAAVPTDGLDTPRVRETVTPTVLLGADLLQRARVVLAVPRIPGAPPGDETSK
jgi:hypothetical protein